MRLEEVRHAAMAHGAGGLSADEKRAYDQLEFFFTKGLAYAQEMGNRPQTLYGIEDSPVGLAAWILDHDARSYALIARVFDGQAEGLTRDDVLDNVTLYWLTNTAVSSASRISVRRSEVSERNGATRPETTGGQRVGVAVLAGGCFWGVEEILRGVPGVIDTEVGYAGGWLKNPKYEDTHDGESGHAEAVRVTFDPTVPGFEELPEGWFFRLHDPTTPNRQGNDIGTQYRSAIFPQTDEQQATHLHLHQLAAHAPIRPRGSA